MKLIIKDNLNNNSYPRSNNKFRFIYKPRLKENRIRKNLKREGDWELYLWTLNLKIKNKKNLKINIKFNKIHNSKNHLNNENLVSRNKNWKIKFSSKMSSGKIKFYSLNKKCNKKNKMNKNIKILRRKRKKFKNRKNFKKRNKKNYYWNNKEIKWDKTE